MIPAFIKAKNNENGPSSDSFLLLEDGSFLLLEDGSFLILEGV